MSVKFKSMVTVFEKNGHFHTVELTNSHKHSNYYDLFMRLWDYNWEIVSVVVHDTVGATEILENIPSFDNLSDFFEEVVDNVYQVETAVAFVLALGWEEWEGYAYRERCYGRYDNEEDFAEAVTILEYSDLEIPEWVEVDWQTTADNLTSKYGYTLVRHNGETFAFTDC